MVQHIKVKHMYNGMNYNWVEKLGYINPTSLFSPTKLNVPFQHSSFHLHAYQITN